MTNMTSKLKDMLEEFKREMMGDDVRVIKTFAMRPEWQKLWDELKAATREQERTERKRESKKRQFWAKVEADLDCYEEMRVNSKTGEVEIYEEMDDDRPQGRSTRTSKVAEA